MKSLVALAGLMKIRLSLAVTFSAATGYLLFDNYPGTGILIMTAGVFLLASGAAALNQFTESDLDARMERTKERPIPTDRITGRKALLLSILLLIAGSAVLMVAGTLPLLLGLFTVFLYNFVYTSLKKITWFAIVPGALVGAIPPVIGFTAAGGTSPHPAIIMLTSFMFLWQLPHFWLIILRYRSDYQKAGFKTLPGGFDEKLTRILVFAWVAVTSVLLILFSLRELVFDRLITIILIPLNVCFILLFYKVLFSSGHEGEKGNVRTAFILINIFSLAMMLLFIANSFLT